MGSGHRHGSDGQSHAHAPALVDAPADNAHASDADPGAHAHADAKTHGTSSGSDHAGLAAAQHTRNQSAGGDSRSDAYAG